jgi:hypothetical protein
MRGVLKQLPRTTPPRELVRRVRPRSERVQVSAKARSRWLPNKSSPHRCRGLPRRSFHPPFDRDALARAPFRSTVLPFPRGRRGMALDGRAAERATGPTEVGPAEPGRCGGSHRAPGGLSFARRVSPPARVESPSGRGATPRRLPDAWLRGRRLLATSNDRELDLPCDCSLSASPPVHPRRVHSRGLPPFGTAVPPAILVPPSWFQPTSTVSSALRTPVSCNRRRTRFAAFPWGLHSDSIGRPLEPT